MYSYETSWGPEGVEDDSKVELPVPMLKLGLNLTWMLSLQLQ